MPASDKIRRLTLLGLFAAIIVLLASTPLGYIQLAVIKATIIHVPVIIGSILLGPSAGALLGLLFGITSLISNTFAPTLLSFAFSPVIALPGTGQGSLWALVICFVPRIIVGIVPYFVHRFICLFTHNRQGVVGLTAAGVAGALTNTLLVMPLIYLLLGDAFAAARNIPVERVGAAVISIIVGNGIPEALVAGILAMAVCKAVMAIPALNLSHIKE